MIGSTGVIFGHAHSPVDRGKGEEEEGDPPLTNEDARLKDLVVSPVILSIVLSQCVNLGLLIPQKLKILLKTFLDI